MNKKLIIRYIIFLIGLFLMGLGIAMTAKSGLGTTPISSVPLLLSKILPLTFGELAFLLSLVFILVELLILRNEFSREQYLQALVAPFFGYFIDLGMLIFKHLTPIVYWEKILVILIGCVILALGIYLQVAAKVLVNSAEGVVKVIAKKTHSKFGTIKVYFDSSLVVISLIISLIAFRKIMDIREGTLIVAVTTGSITKIYKRIFEKLGIRKLYE